MLVLALITAVGCTAPPPAHTTPARSPLDARATLEAFFEAWRAKDKAALEPLLVEDRRDGDAWGFEELDRIEFGAITEAPGEVADYLEHGRGSVSGVAADDVAVFRANATFYFKPGVRGPVASGATQDWKWVLVRGADGVWRIDDWGY
jgi:hypothetical protein